MLEISCPWCGPRSEIEFRYGGEAHLVRPVGDGTSEEEWGAYLYLRGNKRGEHAERWRHIHGCGQFFNVLRDTASDRIYASYPPGAERPAVGGDS